MKQEWRLLRPDLIKVVHHPTWDAVFMRKKRWIQRFVHNYMGLLQEKFVAPRKVSSLEWFTGWVETLSPTLSFFSHLPPSPSPSFHPPPSHPSPNWKRFAFVVFFQLPLRKFHIIVDNISRSQIFSHCENINTITVYINTLFILRNIFSKTITWDLRYISNVIG